MPRQDVVTELRFGGEWQAVPPFAVEGIKVTRGQGAEGRAPRPAAVNVTLDNRADTFRPSNPESPLYGLAGRNTPMRVTVGSSVRALVEASSWSPDQTADFDAAAGTGRAWTTVQAGGVLQRVGQWSEVLRSPFYTYNVGMSQLAGYWPMEDARGATRAASPVDGARNSSLIGQSFDSQQRPPGSAPVASIDTNADAANFRMAPGDATSTDGWQYSFTVYLGSLDNTIWSIVNLDMANGYGLYFTLDDTTNTTYLEVFDPNGFLAAQQTQAWGHAWTGRWILFNIQARYAAGTTTYSVYWRATDEDFWWTISTTEPIPPSILTSSFVNGLPPGSAYGHVLATHGVSDEVTDEARVTAWRGYAGETAAARFARLCTAKNVPYSIVGTAVDTMPMGPQPVATFAELIRECAQTDDALIYDARDGVELVFRTRVSRYNQAAALALTYPGDIGPPLREVLDDLDLHNLVTVEQRDGGAATAELTTGLLSTQDPPDGAGTYEQRVDVNVADEDASLQALAQWWLGRGTVDVPRWPTVTVDLTARPDLTAAVDAVDVGDRITITGRAEYVIDLFVLGYTEQIGTHTRKVTFTCAPGRQFDVGEYDAARYDLRTCTLSGEHSAAATSLSLAITSNERWSTTATPYDLLISGERVTVTAMGARTGTGPYAQTATVSRSANGISKTLPAGSAVHIATPGRYAL